MYPMAGSVTSTAGTCAMPSTRTIAASTPAQGTPATSRQMPTMMAWMKATPSTPLATARMVAVDRSTNSAPRGPSAILSKIERIPRAPESPKAIMMPATAREAMNSSSPPPMLATKASDAFAEVADLRLHALHQCRKIGVSLRPERMHFRPDHGPFGDAFSRRRYLQGVVLDVVDEAPYRVAERAHERGGRHHDDHDSQQHQQRRRKSLAATQLRGDRLLQGIETDEPGSAPTP